jgi:hypothetical protein
VTTIAIKTVDTERATATALATDTIATALTTAAIRTFSGFRTKSTIHTIVTTNATIAIVATGDFITSYIGHYSPYTIILGNNHTTSTIKTTTIIGVIAPFPFDRVS